MPHFDYGHCVYDIATNEQLNRLQVLQNMALRSILSRDSHSPVFELHVDLNVLPFSHRRHLRVANECYKAVHCNGYSLTDFFVPIVPADGCCTRAISQRRVVEPKAINNSGRRAFMFTGPRLWNKIPEEFRACQSLEVFKSEYKLFVTTNYHQGENQNFPT